MTAAPSGGLHGGRREASLHYDSISTHGLHNLIACNGGFEGEPGPRRSRLSLSCKRLEKEEEILPGIDLRLIHWRVTAVFHRALVPRSQIPPGILEP